MGSVTETQPMNMKIFVAIAFLVAVTECRRHLCEDGTRPVCPNGDKAVYNRPTGKNTDGSKYFPPPVCSGEGKPVCADGSEARVMFNQCTKDKMKCPTGQGFGPSDKPFPACGDGSKCHCPWATKNRNKHDGVRVYNTGVNRPGNKAKNWGP